MVASASPIHVLPTQRVLKNNTLSGERFLLCDDRDADKIVMFATQENLKLLSEANSIYMDGTFEVCPSMFYQLYTINAFIHGKQFPLLYALLPAKSREVYNRMFMLLKESMQNFGIQIINPQNVIFDFELALIQAAELHFPGANLHGCYFHFAQCLWRKVQELGLSSDYKDDEHIRAFIQKSAALSFVPITFVRIAWNNIKQAMPPDPRLQQYCDYFESTWLNGNFRLPMWNYFAYDGPCTNNHLEGWHNRLKRIARKSHPNIYEMLELLQKEPAATEVTIRQLEAGGILRARRLKWIRRDERIQKLKTELQNGTRNLDSYIGAIKHLAVSFD